MSAAENRHTAAGSRACPDCSRAVYLNLDGRLRRHRTPQYGQTCAASGTFPVRAICLCCGKRVPVESNALLAVHQIGRKPCSGSGTLPVGGLAQ